MKSEDRIVELLTESLQKQDQLAAKVDRLTDSVSTLASATSDLREIASSQLKVQQSFNDRFDRLEIEVKNVGFYLSKVLDVQRQINDLNERMDRLENAS